MEKKAFTLKYKEHSYSFPEGTTYLQAIDQIPVDAPAEVLLVTVDGRLHELMQEIQEDGTLQPITLKDPQGQRAYTRSLIMLLYKSIKELCGRDARYAVTVQRSVNNGLYCTLTDPSVLTDDWLETIKNKMMEYCEQAQPIQKHLIKTRNAAEMFREEGFRIKSDLMWYRLSSYMNVYEIDGYYDYYYGYMAANTSVLKQFDLKRFNDGFVLVVPKASCLEAGPYFKENQKLFLTQKETSDWGYTHHAANVSELNEWIISGKMKELILVQEAFHEMQVTRIAYQIVQQPSKRLVMIAGPSSSGKTTFSHRLSTQLSAFGKTPHPIPMDDYFVDRVNTPLDEDGKPDFECLEALDIEQFNKDMVALLAGERVELPTYNFKTGKREYNGKYLQLGKDDVLVIEGIHGLNDRLSYALPAEQKFKIYISALTQLNLDESDRIPTTDGRLLRRMVRDARTRGTSAEGTINMWNSVRRGEDKHIFPHQESADAMFNSSLVYEFAILKIYAEPYLQGVKPDSPAYQEAKRMLKFLSYFVPMTPECIPMNSLVREFIGGSCFDV